MTFRKAIVVDGREQDDRRKDSSALRPRCQGARRRGAATTEAVAIVPARALGGRPVTRILDRLAIERACPARCGPAMAPSSVAALC